MPARPNENFDERAKERFTQQDVKFKAQMRAAEHRYREIVRALHKKEEETKDLVATVKAVEQRLSARVKEVERGRKTMLIERSHSDRLARIVSMVRAQVLKLHVNAGSGADRALQRVPFHFSSNENTREQQLRLEYGIEKKGQTNSSDEDKRDTSLSRIAMRVVQVCLINLKMRSARPWRS